jgi:hypothetical protein
MAKAGIILMLTVFTVQAGLSPLEAISMIESGNNDDAVGQAGEVSRYQIRPRVWRQFSQSLAYDDARVAEAVARRYLDWLSAYLNQRAGRVADDFDLYVMWNAGPAYYARIGFSKERVHPIVRERAQRFVNLREMRTAAVQTPAPPVSNPIPERRAAAPNSNASLQAD